MLLMIYLWSSDFSLVKKTLMLIQLAIIRQPNLLLTIGPSQHFSSVLLNLMPAIIGMSLGECDFLKAAMIIWCLFAQSLCAIVYSIIYSFISQVSGVSDCQPTRHMYACFISNFTLLLWHCKLLQCCHCYVNLFVS